MSYKTAYTRRSSFPPQFYDFITLSWQQQNFSLYGRFDFAFDGHSVKLLEYNADTPTGLIEAAAIQWFWLQDIAKGDASLDQYNSIHERLIEGWVAARAKFSGMMHFTSLPDYSEDYMTALYLRDTAMQAGFKTDYIEIQEIGWNDSLREFVDSREQPIKNMFKLYPWEWLVNEEFGTNLLQSLVHWLEPPWKMLLSNKAILPVLNELFPDSPYLLRSEFEPFGNSYVKKPILGREGANATVVVDGQTVASTAGPYDGQCIYQEYVALPKFDGNYPVIGSWVVNGFACGMGIREDSTLITGDTSRFVPHLIRG